MGWWVNSPWVLWSNPFSPPSDVGVRDLNRRITTKSAPKKYMQHTEREPRHQVARYFGWINAARDVFVGLWGQWGKCLKRHENEVILDMENLLSLPGLVVWGNFLLVSLRLTREFRTKFKDSPLPHVLCLMTKWYQMTVKWLSNDYEWLRNSSPNVSETDLLWSSWTFPRADRATAELPTLQWSPGDLPRRTTCRSATAHLAAFCISV